MIKKTGKNNSEAVKFFLILYISFKSTFEIFQSTLRTFFITSTFADTEYKEYISPAFFYGPATYFELNAANVKIFLSFNTSPVAKTSPDIFRKWGI